MNTLSSWIRGENEKYFSTKFAQELIITKNTNDKRI